MNWLRLTVGANVPGARVLLPALFILTPAKNTVNALERIPSAKNNGASRQRVEKQAVRENPYKSNRERRLLQADEMEKGRRVDISVETAENEGGTGASAPVVHLGGEIDLHTCPELRASLQGLIDNGSTHIILDMANVPYVDSAALGVLVDTQRRLKEKSGTLYLAAVSPFVLRAFEITRLIRIFNVKDTVSEAAQAAAVA